MKPAKSFPLTGTEKRKYVMPTNEDYEILQKVKKHLNTTSGVKNFMKTLITLASQQKEMSKALEKVTGEKFDFILPHLER